MVKRLLGFIAIGLLATSMSANAIPAIDIEKLVNGTDSDAAPGLSVPVLSTVTFAYLVANVGNESLSSVVVIDDNATPINPADDFQPTFVSGDVNADGLLGVSELWTYVAVEIATAGSFGNQAVVSAFGVTGLSVSDSDTAFYVGIQVVPEPATLALFSIALAGLGFSRPKRAVK